MANSMKDSDPDTQVTYDDQQKINQFARNNAKLQDLKDELENKKKELQNLEDACDEMLMVEDESLVPYQIGEVFVSLGVDSANEMLEKAKENTMEEMKGLEQQCEAIQTLLQDLKVKLYAKFGNNIKLEADEE
ncbi:prefoldin subunit 4-like [Crassostrea angulata]|uniref:prefoldin subunit 4 n=1 Tax=Magallana gigas TaxID=29159 RepID=UPI0005C3627D|nr:prefoldin subunit 4 [Crassostrea gigas]XP_052712870.1 prefoldin subunit 4-like [Crassostrea angulata]|eukprot:XP_011431802.1 PREDICTED: prefoldin subunit 4-like [Crassostrea gigas]